MRPEIAEADRRFEVVRAAAAWRDAGAVDGAAFDRVAERYRDDRRRTRGAFRFLFFVFTLLGGQAAWGFTAMVLLDSGELSHAVLLLVLAALAGFATAAAIEANRLRRFGVEEAFVALGLIFVAAAAFLLANEAGAGSRATLAAVGATTAAAAGLAAWRWGIPLCGAIALGGLLAALYAVPGARWLWLLTGIGAASAATRIAARPWTPATHRRRLDEAAVVGWLAAYVSVHAEGVRSGLFRFDRGSEPASPPLALELAWTAMFLLPVVLLAVGIRSRDRLALSLGALLLLVSGGGAVDALDLGPVWLVLLVAGAALLAISALLRHRFSRSPRRVAGGFTDGPLYEGDRHSALEIAAAVAVFTPEPRRESDPEGFRGGDGEFGGGGASSKF